MEETVRQQIRNATISSLMITWVVALSGLGGCTDQPGPETSTSPGPPSLLEPSPSRSTDLAATGRDALDAYRGMWRSYQDALTIPDPTYPDLARYATGEALSTLTKGLRSLQSQRLKGNGDIQVNPKITGAAPKDAPTELEVTDCLDSSRSHIVRAAPGPVYSDSPGGHRRVMATVKRQPNGSWKVSSFAAQAVGTC